MIKRLEALYRRATPGEWAYNAGTIESRTPEAHPIIQAYPSFRGVTYDIENLELVVEMHRTLPTLIEAVKALAQVTACLGNWMEIANEEDKRDYDYEARDRALAVLEKLEDGL